MSERKIYPQIYEEISEWPIHRLYADRKQFVQEIDSATVENLVQRYGHGIDKLIARSVYLELIRLKENPWKVDPPNEKQFWKRVKKELAGNSKHREDIRFERNKALLRRIVHRYSDEIAGNFHIKTFRFARKFLTSAFKRLLNAAAGRNYRRIWGTKYNLYERIKVYGNYEKARDLFDQGTIVIVPTHFSNLDSIMIGYALDAIVGLPSFSYGAGLNLYESEVFAYFMNRLGAYRVDRRKRNPIYLETLKTMSSLSLRRGVNTIFFPGGTRSRSGAMETELKLGLLNSLVDAQRRIYEEGGDRKIIIVPLIIGYHFVLEANLLINQFLSRTGEEKFIPEKTPFGLRKILKFAWQFFSESSEIALGFGSPMDVLGYEIRTDGKSYDPWGREVRIRDYFLVQDEIQPDRQRENVYTRLLAKRIVESFYRDNVVLSSHLVAFCAFQILQKMNPELDVFGLIRLPSEDFYFPERIFRQTISQVLERLKTMEAKNEVRLSDDLQHKPNQEIIHEGIKKLGTYHTTRTLLYTKKGRIASQNFKLLFYYHNRLTGYGLESAITWDEHTLQEAVELVS